MSDIFRKDGKPFVKDNRNAVPTYVVENDDEGDAIFINQFSGLWVKIGQRPYSKAMLREACLALKRKEQGTE